MAWLFIRPVMPAAVADRVVERKAILRVLVVVQDIIRSVVRAAVTDRTVKTTGVIVLVVVQDIIRSAMLAAVTDRMVKEKLSLSLGCRFRTPEALTDLDQSHPPSRLIL